MLATQRIKMTRLFTVSFSILLITIAYSCNRQLHQVTETVFTFSVHLDAPIFQNEHRYSKVEKQAQEVSINGLKWYLIDWNENGIYNELAIDYIGIKHSTELRPKVALINKKNLISYNGKSYQLDSVNISSVPTAVVSNRPINLSYIDRYIPITLTKNEISFNPDFASYDKTVFYFWATWCMPCVSKMQEYHYSMYEFKEKNIQFIPIAYKSDSLKILDFYSKHNMQFDPIIISDSSAKELQLLSVPRTYVFNKDGILIETKFNSGLSAASDLLDPTMSQ